MSTNNLQKVNKIVALLCTIAIIVVTASIISKLVWQVLDKNKSVTLDSWASKKQVVEKSLYLPKNLFGAINEISKKSHSKIQNTRLNITLIGILYKKDKPFVIIRHEGGKEKIYQVNDFVTPSTTLKEVYSNYVILEHNDKIEKLVLRRNDINAENISNKPTVQISNSNKSKLNHYLEVLKTNPQNLSEILFVEPNYKNQKLHGFVISPGREKALFEELGFQKNDIILSINNHKLNNLLQAVKLRSELSQKRHFEFTIDRKGQIHYLTLNLN